MNKLFQITLMACAITFTGVSVVVGRQQYRAAGQQIRIWNEAYAYKLWACTGGLERGKVAVGSLGYKECMRQPVQRFAYPDQDLSEMERDLSEMESDLSGIASNSGCH